MARLSAPAIPPRVTPLPTHQRTSPTSMRRRLSTFGCTSAFTQAVNTPPIVEIRGRVGAAGFSEEGSSGRGFGPWLNIFADLAVVGGVVFRGA